MARRKPYKKGCFRGTANLNLLHTVAKVKVHPNSNEHFRPGQLALANTQLKTDSNRTLPTDL